MYRFRTLLLLAAFGVSCHTMAVAQVSADRTAVVLSTPDFAITEQEFYDYLAEQRIKPEDFERLLSVDGAVRNIFESMLVIKSFAHKAEHNETISLAAIDGQVARYRDRLLMDQQVELEVTARLEGVDWTQAAREHYLVNKGEFVVPERWQLEHILIGLQGRSLEQARERAMQVKTRLQDGEDFHVLVQEYSDDERSRKRQGSLGMVTRGQMVKAFEEAAFQLTSPGELSDVVETDYGFHIIRLVTALEARQRSFEELERQLVVDLQAKRRAEVRKGLIDEIKFFGPGVEMEVNEELLEAMEARFRASTQSGQAD